MELHWVDQGGAVLQAREQNPRRHSGMNYDGVFRGAPQTWSLRAGTCSGKGVRQSIETHSWSLTMVGRGWAAASSSVLGLQCRVHRVKSSFQ